MSGTFRCTLALREPVTGAENARDAAAASRSVMVHSGWVIMSAMPVKLSHLFGGIVGGIVFGLLCGLLLGSCVFPGGPNHQAVSGLPPEASAEQGSAAAPAAAPQAPGGMDPGGSVMESVFAKVNQLKQAIEKNPNDRVALIDLANLYYDAAKFDQAIPYYERALALQRDDPNTLTDTANCYWMSGHPDQALAIFREVQAKFPAHWQSAANMFFLAASQRDVAMAHD